MTDEEILRDEEEKTPHGGGEAAFAGQRIVDISERGCGLSVRHEQLLIRAEGLEAEVPLEDIAVLVVAHPDVHYTHAVLTGVAQKGGAFVLCNEKHLPAAMLLPFEGHFTQAERFALQARAKEPLKKILWKQIVQSKMAAQGALLSRLGRDPSAGSGRGGNSIAALIPKVRAGDPENVEAWASRRYWAALFGEKFRRDRKAEDFNRHLNYGYAVLRASAARAVCAAGLHPSLGVHHHNRCDAFCLADDLMEPFRPLVDEAVYALVEAHGPAVAMDKLAKAALVQGITERRLETLEGEKRTLFDTLARAAQSLAAAFAGKTRKLSLPEW